LAKVNKVLKSISQRLGKEEHPAKVVGIDSRGCDGGRGGGGLRVAIVVRGRGVAAVEVGNEANRGG